MSDKYVISTEYNSLADYIGRALDILRWYKEYEFPPSEAKIIGDYPETVLIELTHTACEWGVKVPPRKIIKQITKAAMATGDIKLRVKETGEILTGKAIGRLTQVKEDDKK